MSERSDNNDARERLRLALAKTVGRERELGREGFFQLPERVQNQLAVLQAQATPKEETLEALLAAEHNVKTYNQRLDDAFNLVAQLAGEAGRRAAGSRRRTNVALGGLALLAVVLAGGLFLLRQSVSAKAAECREAAGCRELGLCSAAMSWSPPMGVSCRPGSDEDCKSSSGCRDSGRCKSVEGVCAAASDEDCAGTPRCKDKGLCSAKDGDCIADKPQDCRRTEGCKTEGTCTPISNVCRVGSDADCRQSEMCDKHGYCTEVDHKCAPDGFAAPGGSGAPAKGKPPGAGAATK